MNITTVNGVRITLFGHASVCIEAPNMVVYVDPYVVPKAAKQADLILHTHAHFDHCALPAHIIKPNTTILGSRSCKHPGQSVEAGQNLKFSGAIIQVVDSYNTNKPFHKRGEGVGYILQFASGTVTTRIYVAGDTDRIDEMKNFKCDVAILPIGGTYTMNADEAAAALADIKPRIAIPYHYNYLSDQKIDPQLFKQAASKTCPQADIRILIP
ncbi:Beta-lactamase superfamily domain protein [uncultured archaeon]|nr:Beta-lactamase superfamily domain protein [uncultured archaeon]